jgi:hypothetical protein
LKDLEHLRELKCLKNLDLENNEVTKAAGYKDAVWKMIPSLEILDNHNREGEEMLSESDEDDYGDEVSELDDEQRAILKERGITEEQWRSGEGLFYDDEEGEDEFGFEGGEDEMYEEGESSLSEVEQKGGKRAKH